MFVRPTVIIIFRSGDKLATGRHRGVLSAVEFACLLLRLQYDTIQSEYGSLSRLIFDLCLPQVDDCLWVWTDPLEALLATKKRLPEGIR